MSCPHSTRFDVTPETCSQCLMVAARKVSYDPDTRVMLVDGVATERKMDIENHAPPNTGAKNNGRRQKTCSQCGRTGHTRKNCHGQASTEPGTEAMEMEDRAS